MHASTAIAPPPADLRRARAVLLTTFRRDGTPVATPVWTVERDGVLWATSAANAGKVKRLGHTGRVLLAPCTQRGVPTGPAREARARVRAASDAPWLAAAFHRRYPVFARVFHAINRLQGQSQVAIEFAFPGAAV